jgi:T1SS-143 domain-containing protein
VTEGAQGHETGSETTSGTIAFTDADLTNVHLVSAAFKSTDYALGQLGSLTAVKTTDTTGSGSGGLLTWTFTATDAALSQLAQGQIVHETYTVTLDDQNGGVVTRDVTVTITGTDEAPVITSTTQTGAVTEDTNVDNSGNLNAGGTITFTDVDLTDKHTVTFTAGGNNYLGTFTPTLTHDATGGSTGTVGWTFSVSDHAVDFLAAGQTLTQTYTVKVADNNGGFTTQDVTITITGTNEAPVVTSASAAVSEEGLPNGVPDTLPAGLDTTNSTTASGAITATDVDTGDVLTMTLGTPTTPLTSGGVAITWTLQDTNHTLVGKAGATTIITATITDAGAYNVTLSGPIDHPVANQEDDKTLAIPVNVSDGHVTTSTTLSVSIEDDSPKAQPVEVSVDTTDSQTNVMLIIDVSGSMDSSSGVSGFATRLDAAKAAIDDLLDKYDSRGDVRVQIVKFSTGASQVGTDWVSVADAKRAIDDLSAGGNTNYSAALTTAMNIFGDQGKLSGPGTQNVSYFLSDGEPTSGEGIGSTQQHTWEQSFLTTNNIISFALGISNSPTTTALQPIAFDPAPGTQLADTPIIVTDLGQLANTLVFTIPPVTGSVLTSVAGATSNSFGADGGHVQSITVDGVTYTFNPTTNSITTGGGAGSFTYNAGTKTLTVDTDTGASGGELAMVMTTGAFTFQPPTNFSSESVRFVLVDGDGDTASSTLELTANTLPAGVAGSPINLGLTDPADHAGPVTVTIAGVPSGWALSEGAHNADGNWTIQASNASTLSITSPDNYAGAMVLQVTMSWTNTDGSSGFARATDNVEVFAQGTPIFAWSGDDHLTGSSGKDLFVFSQPIGDDTIYRFDASGDRIDLIGYAGFANFDDVQRHLGQDSAGNAVISLADGQSITLSGVPVSSVSASNFVFDHTPTLSNAGTMTIDDGATLPLSGIIDNTGTIALDSTGNDTHLELIQHGITLQGGGQLILSDSGENFISGTVQSVNLTNADNTISGAGQLGAGQMTLVNDGTIVATGSHPLVIDTGANVVISVGTLEATGTGGLIVNSDVANSGLIWADGGNITINGAVTGSGSAMINGTATLEFGAASSNDVTFAANAAGTLTLDHSLMQPFSAVISGLGADDTIDLKDFAFTNGNMTVSTSLLENGNTMLVVSNTSTQQSVTLTLAGDYTHSAWHFAQGSSGTGTAFSNLPATDTARAASTTAWTGTSASDPFVFAANFGHETITNFRPDTDVIEIDHTVFADVQALLAGAHDDGHGNAVITADPHDNITVKNVTVAQLVQHHGDFHFT